MILRGRRKSLRQAMNLHVEIMRKAENTRRRLYVYDPFPPMYLFNLGILLWFSTVLDLHG